MGIQGLLPKLSSITNEKAHISKYAKQKVAIDTYVRNINNNQRFGYIEECLEMH
jgi:hypothetical protein